MKRLKRENVPDLKSYHIGIDGLRRDHYGSRAIEQADSIEDPVIHALLRFGTIRALTDILPHLIVRQDNPVELLYYTADDIKRDGGPNLYEINKEWGEVLQNRSANGRCVPGVELNEAQTRSGTADAA